MDFFICAEAKTVKRNKWKMDNSLCFMGLWFLLVGDAAANIEIIFDLAKKMFIFGAMGKKTMYIMPKRVCFCVLAIG